jgi:hypothetical protein
MLISFESINLQIFFTIDMNSVSIEVGISSNFCHYGLWRYSIDCNNDNDKFLYDIDI